MKNVIDINNLSADNNQLLFLYNLKDLPSELSISTISITFDINAIFFIKELRELCDLRENGITTIKYYDMGKVHIRSLYPEKYLKKKKKYEVKKKKKMFSNQVTLIVDSNDVNKYNNDTSIKMFNNGAIQVSGCMGYDHFKECLDIAFAHICTDKYVWENDKFIIKPFINKKNIVMHDIKNFKINLINLGFETGFRINREKLNKLLISKGIECSYEPVIYAGVKILYKYKYKNYVKNISVTVFERGYVMINGGIYKTQIVETYLFITKIFYEHYKEIRNWSILDFMKKTN
jgi:hypothetical protein